MVTVDSLHRVNSNNKTKAKHESMKRSTQDISSNKKFFTQYTIIPLGSYILLNYESITNLQTIYYKDKE